MFVMRNLVHSTIYQRYFTEWNMHIEVSLDLWVYYFAKLFYTLACPGCWPSFFSKNRPILGSESSESRRGYWQHCSVQMIGCQIASNNKQSTENKGIMSDKKRKRNPNWDVIEKVTISHSSNVY